MTDQNERIRRLEDAFKMLCDWTGYDPAKRNTVVTIGLDDILNGRDTDMVKKARELVERAVIDRKRGFGRRITG